MYFEKTARGGVSQFGISISYLSCFHIHIGEYTCNNVGNGLIIVLCKNNIP